MRLKAISLFLPCALLIAFCGAGCGAEKKEAAPAASGVVAGYVSAGLDEPAPMNPIWDKAPEMEISLLTQDLTDPKLIEPTLSNIRVRALNDDRNLAFRIEWKDSTRDEVDTHKQFSDAVAVQLPPSAGGEVPDPTMGQAGRPVHIHLWKASYEREMNLGEWDLRQTFPNATVDHYPFEAGSGQEKEALTEQYTAAVAAGNPLSSKRTSAVDDLTAQGFGTLTSMPQQSSKGWSDWRDGRWSVVISRPLSVSESAGDGLKAGQNTFVAFAVWDGSRDQAGSRKMRTAWIPLRIGGGS